VTAPVSASEFAAIQIRKSILDGTLEPGARIQQHALASELGVSHVPLREAIQRLEAEGFLAVHPRRGAFVMPLSIEDISEIFELRAMLEGRALRASIPALTSEQLQIVRETCAAADRVTDLVRYGELNVQFHRSLYAGAGRPRLQAMIETLWGNAARYSMLLRFKGDHFERSQSEHWDLVEAAVTGDVERACTTLKDHIAAASRKIVELMSRDHGASNDQASADRKGPDGRETAAKSGPVR
jgi:DNA-binding GntR family transcriptional regulator